MKIRRIFVIALHILAWVAFYFLPDLLFDAPSGEIDLIKRNLHFILVFFFFYLNYFLFVPFLLLRKRQLLFATVLVLSVVLTYYVNDSAMAYVHDIYTPVKPLVTDQKTTLKTPNIRLHRWERRRNAENTGTAVFVLLGFLISTVLYETKEWYQQEKVRKEIEKQKLVSELSFLKSQVNPHFLFNSLNGIYALAIKKSDKTPDAVLQLSDLLRHMLYDADEDKVLLSKEVDYLKNYIQLQKLRLPANADITFETTNLTSDFEIEPLLFIPFVENAFKHGVDAHGSEIKINLVVADNQLHFSVLNRVSEAKSKDKASGIGLSNVKKRLDLHYGGRYSLNYGAEKGYFRVDLKLNLKMA
ncbi:MAG: histidine kinase [Bacteroidales bacterium]|nr:histidine kinase [Bacteroidales bacterium]